MNPDSCSQPLPFAMSKSDTWPGGVAMESLSNIDSAGSCDSVISVNSGYSEDSMEHLSAEERACLMYLEEMIEALEVQEDSGISNDEPESVSEAEKMGQMTVNDISSLKSDKSRADQVEHHALNQTTEPQSSPASAAKLTDPETSKHPVTESSAGWEIPPSAAQPQVLCLSKDGVGSLKIVSSERLSPSLSAMASEIDLGLIPPPSDFMDEPGLPPQPQKAKDLPPSAGISSNKSGATVDVDQLRQRASVKRTSLSSSVTQEPPNKPPEVSPLASSSAPQIHPPPAAEPRSPPAVAPKPKLPLNIVLKSHKAAAADGNSGRSVPPSSDRLLLDPQKVRIEALRKLGLLKTDEADSSSAVSPKLSPKTRASWAAPPTQINTAAPHTPPSTPSYTHVKSPSPASVQFVEAVSPSGTSTAPAVEFLDILPVPDAFSDSNGSVLSDNELSAVKGISEAAVNAPGDLPPLSPPVLFNNLTPPNVVGVKSATLERSGLGLSQYMVGQDSDEASQDVSSKQSLSHLRNSRPRPASLGSGKDLSSAQGEGAQAGCAASKGPDSRRSAPPFQHSADSQKLPRSQGISVLICPRAEKGDDRREALKRLGLLRD